MVRRYELSDEAYGLLADLLPPNGRRGGQWHDHRTTLNGIFWILHTGAQWRELPARYGTWPSVSDRYNRWRRDGTIDRMLERLHLQLDAEGRIDVALWCLDATPIRASRAAAGAARAAGKRVAGEPADHALGRSRGGFGTKVHLVVDSTGVPLAATVSAGQRQESLFVDPVPRLVRLRRPGRRGRPRTRPQRLAGDKGDSYPTVRRYLRRRGIGAVIPTRSNQRARPHFDRRAYRGQNIIERVVGWLKESRRLATRCEKLAVNFLAMVKLAMIQRCLRVLDSSDRA